MEYERCKTNLSELISAFDFSLFYIDSYMQMYLIFFQNNCITCFYPHHYIDAFNDVCNLDLEGKHYPSYGSNAMELFNCSMFMDASDLN